MGSVTTSAMKPWSEEAPLAKSLTLRLGRRDLKSLFWLVEVIETVSMIWEETL